MNVIISAGGKFHAHQLAQQLIKRNSLQRFYTFSADQETHVIKNYRLGAWLDWAYFKLRINRIISPSRYNNHKDKLFDFWVSKKISQETPFDVLVGWANYATKIIPIARARGAKIIIESGSCHIATQQQLLEQEYKKLGLRHKPITQQNRDRMMYEYEQADYIMTLSSFARQSFIHHGFKSEKILTVPCGADVEYFNVDPMVRDGASHLLTTNGLKKSAHPEEPVGRLEGFIVIFVGLLSIRKGVHHLIDAWHQLNLPEDKAQLLLVGSMQQDLQHVLNQKKVKKNIIFYGPTKRETLRKLYQEASVFVLSSIEDGFGMVMGEAMASGLPVICTMNTGAPDVIVDGNEGFLVQAGDAQALADKIRWCYENPQQAYVMGMRARQTIKGYTWDVYGEKVYEAYKQVLRIK